MNGIQLQFWATGVLPFLVGQTALAASLAGPFPFDPVVPGFPKPTFIEASSPNTGNRAPGVAIDTVVMHTTEVDLPGTLAIFDSSASQVSAHFTIAPNGDIYQHVATDGQAWHATYYNSRSIGIEMVGYSFQPETWNESNLAALTDLLAWISLAYPEIELTRPTGDAYDTPNNRYDEPGVVAHGQIQPWNRSDPGPYFPWDDVLAEASAKAVPEPTAGLALFGVAGATLRRLPRRA
ncbi:MAG: N-acetylmuramoyl-L-alanine amidase [Planctomycetota bacterium]